MKFSVENKDLIKALSIVSRAIGIKNTMSVLECVYISAKNDKLTLKASDTEISIITSIEASVTDEGETLLPFKTMFELIRTYPNERVYFNIDDMSFATTITCSQSEVNILAQNPLDFPVFKAVEAGEFIKLGNEEFKDVIRETVFACAPQLSINPILSGVNVEIGEKELVFTALDGYKMALRRISAQTTSGESGKSAIVPGRTLSEILKIASFYTDDIYFAITSNRFVLNVGETQIMSILLEGPYINYKTLIPSEINTMVKANKADLLMSLERAGLISDASKNSIVKLNITDDNMNISSSSDRGKIVEDVLVGKTGDDLRIAFNVRFLADVIKNIRDDKIILEYKDSVGPCLIKPVDSERFLYLIMPVRYSD